VVGILLAATATAAAVLGVGDRVIATVRTGICIVGGDLCRTGDAAAAGLPPCVTSARSTRQDTTLDIAVVRLGGHGEWLLALQSDGGAVVTRLEQNEVGGTVGVGLTFSPAGIEGAATAAATIGYRSGRAWRFPDAAAARAFLDGARRDAAVTAGREPDIRWDAIAAGGSAVAGGAIADLTRAGLTTSADGALGLRRDGPRTTLTLDLGAEDPGLALDLPGYPAPPAGVRTVVAEISWEAGAVRDLALRTATARDGRLEELTAQLDLRDRESRAIAERLLRPGARTPDDLRELARRIATHGIVERTGYRVAERRRGFSVGGRLGVALGLSHERITAERRITDAIAWVRGGPPQRRFDCLGV
ncbi:MAG TPA: hypothetical protein VK631_06375, partial [Solirubrobacteraceae bacterium]|nr:hypothetical protein [Solirubrobacteraceae bacterium]